jgi:hypothetical protein
MIFLFLEVVLVAVMAGKLGMEAGDKGFSKALFIFLSIIIWIGSRLLGNFIGSMITYNRLIISVFGWVMGLITYMIFYWFISRMEDKYDFDTDNSWEERNKTSQTNNESKKPD